jgi:hypothetical protein
MQNPMIEDWVQYTHLEKLYGYLPGMDEALMARLFGLERTTARLRTASIQTPAR